MTLVKMVKKITENYKEITKSYNKIMPENLNCDSPIVATILFVVISCNNFTFFYDFLCHI